ncbi:hypothetical protein [Palleronia pontilimi]|nr:hypothetical protein [Palleronia pontilimi]
MKAFLLALVAIAVVSFGANFVLTDVIGFSSAQRTASDSVRLPQD